MTRKNFCIMPWVGMFYNINGGNICCGNSKKLSGSPKDIQSDTFVKELRRSFMADQRHTSCDVCWNAEDAGMTSLRNLYMQHFPDIDPSDYDETSCNSLEYLELRVDNICNFGCRICFPGSSTLIAEEVDSNSNLKKHFAIQQTASLPVSSKISDGSWQEIVDQVHSLRMLQLTGGEPMLVKRFYDFIDLIIDKNLQDQIDLTITTNCSVLNPYIIDRLLKFPNAHIVASIDAVGAVAEYQRYGTDWPTVERNLRTFLQLSNCHVNINGTVTAYTVLDFANLCQWLVDLYHAHDKLTCTFNFVNARPEIHPTILRDGLRRRAIDEMTKGIEILSKSFGPDHPVHKHRLIDHFVGILSTIEEVDTSEHFDQFVEFTKDFDRARNQSFQKTFGYELYE